MAVNENKNVEPKLYKDALTINNPTNQSSYRLNYLNELWQKQQNLNEKLSTGLQEVGKSVNDTKEKQMKYWEDVANRIQEQESYVGPLLEKIKQQDERYEKILNQLDKLGNFNQELANNIKQEALINQAIIDQLTFQEQSTQSITQKLEGFNGLNVDLSSQLSEQEELYNKLNEKLLLQEAFHKTVMERLEQQEALTQKVSRQLDNLKSVVYERVAILLDKIETNFKLTSSFLFSFFSKPNFIQRMTVKKEKEDKEKEVIK